MGGAAAPWRPLALALVAACAWGGAGGSVARVEHSLAAPLGPRRPASTAHPRAAVARCAVRAAGSGGGGARGADDDGGASLDSPGEIMERPPSSSAAPGHVFVVQGDLRRLACDAVLYPTRDIHNPAWFPRGPPEGAQVVPPAAFSEERRVQRLSGVRPSNAPAIWLGQLNSKYAPVPGPDTPLSWFLAAAEQFLSAAEADLRGSPAQPRNGRHRYLLALPVVGTGPRNARCASGDILSSLLRRLYAFADTSAIDVALVVKTPRMFSAAQACRRKLCQEDAALAARQWRCLSAAHLRAAHRLARLATDGQLALFMGAGCSAGTGLPDWVHLLRNLAVTIGMTPAEVRGFSRLSVLDQALVLERRLGGPEALQRAVVLKLQTERHSLVHSLLAALPVDGYVTTNYDDLFELACDGAGIGHTVLPYEAGAVVGGGSGGGGGGARRAPSTGGTPPFEALRLGADEPAPGAPAEEDDDDESPGGRGQRRPSTGGGGVGGGGGARPKRWLLKLHGCVHHPKDIVLTRTQMNEYPDRRQALTGIVQTMLMTKHMLFVGFSLRDENFHKVAMTVNKALAGAAGSGGAPALGVAGAGGAGAGAAGGGAAGGGAAELSAQPDAPGSGAEAHGAADVAVGAAAPPRGGAQDAPRAEAGPSVGAGAEADPAADPAAAGQSGARRGGGGGGAAEGGGASEPAEPPAPQIGTVITLHKRPFLSDLWPQLTLVPMSDAEETNSIECARLLEIFLDRMSLLASTTSRHLLDANFDGTFTPAEVELRRELLAFREKLRKNPRARRASAYRLVRDLLVTLGDDSEGQQQQRGGGLGGAGGEGAAAPAGRGALSDALSDEVEEFEREYIAARARRRAPGETPAGPAAAGGPQPPPLGVDPSAAQLPYSRSADPDADFG